MINVKSILDSYDLERLTIGVLGGHSALDVCHGAKKYGFRTLAVCQKGREKTYGQYYKRRGNKGCVDEVLVLEKFSDILEEVNQEKLRQQNTIFVHNRYFWVYFDFEKVEKDFDVPIFGSRGLVKLEERDQPKNQYYLLDKAGIRTPKVLRKAGEIISDEELKRRIVAHFASKGGPLLVKANEKMRSFERDFFVLNSFADYEEKKNLRIKNQASTAEIIDLAHIEEFVIGAQVNLNFFYSALSEELELMGTDLRRQTNLDGFLRLTAKEQEEIANMIEPKKIETGHIACTVKESLLEKFLELGEKFVSVCKRECAPGIIGPFALQGAVIAEEGREDAVIFDVSMRIPGSPGTRFTPYSGYLYGNSLSYGERIAREIMEARDKGRLGEIVS